jgi:hypothetical protein
LTQQLEGLTAQHIESIDTGVHRAANRRMHVAAQQKRAARLAAELGAVQERLDVEIGRVERSPGRPSPDRAGGATSPAGRVQAGHAWVIWGTSGLEA